MKLSGFKLLAAMCSAAVVLNSGCNSPSDGNSESLPQSQANSSVTEQTTAASVSGKTEITPDTISDKEAAVPDKWDTSITFSDNDLTIDGNGAHASATTAVITKAGTYRITGKCSDGSILVNADGDDKVTLLLDGLTLSNKSGCVIRCENADRLTISLADGSENTIADADSYTDTQEDPPDSAIFSRDDLVINGSGKLTVNANYKDAIKSKDSLKIADGNITVSSVDDGIVGRDRLIIGGGNISISSEGDALKSTNDADDGMGYISITDGAIDITSDADAVHAITELFINGGALNISSGDDGLHAGGALIINNGDINISKSYEALEALTIDINGGRINAVASDDGMNAAGGDDGAAMGFGGDTSRYYISMTDGDVTINAAGDGIDSNGTIALSGGSLIVYGPENGANGTLDYQNSFAVSGGTLVALGSRQMAMAPSTLSQPCISIYSSVSANTDIEVLDENGNAIISVTTPKRCDSLIFSSDKMNIGGSYRITANGTVISEVVAGDGVSGDGATGSSFGGWGDFGNMGGFGGGHHGRDDASNGGARPEKPTPPDDMPYAPEFPEMPEGMEPPEMPDGAAPPEIPVPSESATTA